MLSTRAALLAGFAALAEAQLGPVPELGEPCHGCQCGKVDLRNYGGRTFTTPQDIDGYIYRFRMCDDIPVHELPEGCKPNPGIPDDSPHPAVVKYKHDNPEDCSLVGSFGPCDGRDCGMTFQPPKEGTPFAVTWRYQYGCENTFRVFLSEGHQTSPQQAPYNDPNDQYECYWITHWPSLSAFGHVPGLPHKGGDEGGETHPLARLLLWAFFLFIVYLAVGTAFGVKVQGKPLNIEAVPHIHIWRQVGELGQTGYKWTKDKVNAGRASASKYQGVDSSETASLQSSGEVVSYGASDKGDYDTL